jgi:hypothetical protein
MLVFVWRGIMRKSLAVLALCVVWATASGAASVAAGLSITASRAILTGGGSSVTLVGGYTCGPFANGVPDRGTVDFTITQSLPGGTVTGFGFLTPEVCDGQAQLYTVNLPSISGQQFRSGPALWSASGYVEGNGTQQTVSVPPTSIRIR